MLAWPVEDFVKNAKFWVAYPMASFLRNDLPSRPPLSFSPNGSLDRELSQGEALLYTGWIKRVLKNRLHSFNLKNCRLFLGLLQGVKRGAEVVPPEFIHSSMVKHRAALTRVREVSSDWTAELQPYFDRFFRSFQPSTPRLYEASTSACYGSTRSEGGAREYIRKSFVLGDPTITTRGHVFTGVPSSTSELLGMYEERPGLVREVRGFPVYSLQDLRYEMASHQDDLERRSVMVQAVLEPLKVRLITKGNAFKYWFSRFFQKELWTHLNRYPQFALTGHPVQHSDLYDLVDREKRLGLDFPLWVSGDYSAATDNLKLQYTRMAFEAALSRSGLSEPDKVQLRDVLYEQYLHYPKSQNSKKDLEPVMQTTGQLMGSTLSFPILCAVNLVCYWRTLEKRLGRRVPMKDLPVLVNGDDILFRCDRPFYDEWLRAISEVGFELSLGKNYVHSSFLTVNSTGFLWTPSGRLVDVPFLNVGLLTGQSKIGGSRRETELMPIWAYYNDCISSACDPLRAHHRFIHYNRFSIDALSLNGQYSLFVDQLFGGLGFDLTEEVRSSTGFHFTAFQRRFGNHLRSLYLRPFDGEFEAAKVFRGLVHTEKSHVQQKHVYHYGRYIPYPVMCPLREGLRERLDPSTDLRCLLMASSLLPPEDDSLVIRPPNHSVLRKFRSSRTSYNHVDRLLHNVHRVVEIVPLQ